MRVLGIDYGDRNIGLALSDVLRFTAQPLDTYRLTGRDDEDRTYFKDLILKHAISEIVVGLPLRMDGTAGSRVEKTRGFAKWIGKAASIPVVFWDERLTTHQALNVMHEQKVGLKAKKSVINQISAAIILQAYLDSRRSDANVPQDR
jgi:putative Holliday junction resolvase